MARKVLLMLDLVIMAVFMAGWALAAPVPDTGQTKCYNDVRTEITCPSPEGGRYGGGEV